MAGDDAQRFLRWLTCFLRWLQFYTGGKYGLVSPMDDGLLQWLAMILAFCDDSWLLIHEVNKGCTSLTLGWIVTMADDDLPTTCHDPTTYYDKEK
ncbi:hypothetical protein Pcinc_043239 [Petrolisthes cinctipes]|uniref:Uncharacterized protein n=1 Tax=Petrolisthes cinctipes TaxID=88211 RepID=A0AAE1BJ51_PETCI|nr:hypothetical protein Pcinc_043239 [Petrolisthes cinctipes]